MTWLSNEKPGSPRSLSIYRTDSTTVHFEWEPPAGGGDLTYTVYAFYPDDKIDTDNLENIIASGLHSCHFDFRQGDSMQGKYFAVSASSRYHIEGEICEPAYFLPSLELQK